MHYVGFWGADFTQAGIFLDEGRMGPWEARIRGRRRNLDIPKEFQWFGDIPRPPLSPLETSSFVFCIDSCILRVFVWCLCGVEGMKVVVGVWSSGPPPQGWQNCVGADLKWVRFSSFQVSRVEFGSVHFSSFALSSVQFVSTQLIWARFGSFQFSGVEFVSVRSHSI